MQNNSKIKLAIFSETTSGGTRKHLIDLLLGLNKNKYEIFFIFSKERADETFLSNLSKLKENNIHLVEVSIRREINFLKDFISLIDLYKLIKKIKPDIIHLHATKVGAIGRMAAILAGNKNIIYNPHGGSFHKISGKFGFFYFAIEKFLAKKYIHFIGVSKFTCQQFQKILKIKPENNHLIYNGISTDINFVETINKPELRKKSGLYGNDFIALYPAMFYSEKGHLEFLNFYSLMNETLNPKIKFIFAGEGPLKNKIKKRGKELNLEAFILFPGFIKNIEEYFYFCDIVILPSQKEFLPYAILEGMVFSKPVLASNTGAIEEMIIPGFNGELFPPDKLVELWKRLNYFSIHKDELAVLGINGRKYVEENFSLSKMIRETEMLYDKLYSNSQSE
jgi:glycosyltransferase involved in cell wall biosynthesis